MQQPSCRQTVLLSAHSKRATRQTTMTLVRTNNNNDCCRWICLQQSSDVTFQCGACVTPFTCFFLCARFKVPLHFKGSPKACAIKVNCPQQFKFLFFSDTRICSAPVRLTACTGFFLRRMKTHDRKQSSSHASVHLNEWSKLCTLIKCVAIPSTTTHTKWHMCFKLNTQRSMWTSWIGIESLNGISGNRTRRQLFNFLIFLQRVRASSYHMNKKWEKGKQRDDGWRQPSVFSNQVIGINLHRKLCP